MHYRRLWTHGTIGPAEALTTPPGELLAWIIDVALKYKDKKNCIIWPYSRSSTGYAWIRRKGKQESVHRLICRKIHGRPPTKKHFACHSCGKGQEGCVNQHHLYWGTHAQNSADTVRHKSLAGERNPRAKLTEANVRKILTFMDRGWTDSRIARKFEVSRATIGSIRQGETWSQVERIKCLPV